MNPRHSTLGETALLFAHRGARAHAKENTIDAFLLAQTMGATGLETDVWLTADGVPVLDHDGFVGSLLRRKPIAKVPRADLPDHIPTLQEFYEAVGTDLVVSIDVKDPTAFGPIIETARSLGAEAKLWLCHPNIAELAKHRQDTSAKLICSTRLSKLNNGIERQAQRLSEAEIDGMNMHHSDWNPGFITTLHRFGCLALAWDTQFERQIAKLIDYGIDAIFSDHVDRMVITSRQFQQ